MRLENHLETEMKLEEPLKIAGKEFDSIIIREASGFDEEEVSQPKYKGNMGLIYGEIIFRCIAEVPGADRLPTKSELKNLPSGVLDTILLGIRELSSGDEAHLIGKCPNMECQKEFDSMINLGDIEFKKGSYKPRTLALTKGIIKDGKTLKTALVKCPDGNSQEVLLKHKSLDDFGMIKTDLILSLIINIDGVKPSREDVVAMSNKDRKAVISSVKDAPGPLTTFEVTCKNCGNIFSQGLSVLDFLV
jgi:hypothetical protein